MPGVDQLDPNNKDQQKAADKEFSDRRMFIDKNRQYYNGDMPKPLEDEKDNILLNLCREVVDQTVSFLLPEMPDFEVDNDENTSETEGWLKDFWEANGGATVLSNVATNGGLCGQAYAKVKPAAMDEEEREHAYPRIVNLDPANSITWWKDDNFKLLRGYELRWNDRELGSDKTHSRNLNGGEQKAGHRQIVKYVGGVWEISEYIGTNDGWIAEGEPMVWGYPLPPIVSGQHLPKPNSYYGADEIPHRFLNDAVNKVASDMKSILRYHAFPTTVGTGFNASDLVETSVDGFYSINNPDAKVYNVEMASDLASSMNLLNELSGLFFRQSRVVQIRGGLDVFRGVTNLGIRAAYMPMIAKNETLRRTYSTFIERVSRVALMLDGRPHDIPLRLKWGSALPMDEKEEITNLQMEMAMGIMSKRMAAKRRGRDYDMVRKDVMQEQMDTGVMVEGVPVGVSG